MDQLIVTKWKDRSLTALLSDGHCRSLTLESGDESLLGNIYIGKVKNVVKNINAAFIDLGGGKTGYFSLAENPVPLYTDELNQLCSFEYSGNSEKKVSTRKLKAGDELLVQVSRDALKTKDPSVTCCLNFPGTYMVLTVGKPQIGFSAKIKDNAWKEKVREELLTHKDERFGLIVRSVFSIHDRSSERSGYGASMKQAFGMLCFYHVRLFCWHIHQHGAHPPRLLPE